MIQGSHPQDHALSQQQSESQHKNQAYQGFEKMQRYMSCFFMGPINVFNVRTYPNSVASTLLEKNRRKLKFQQKYTHGVELKSYIVEI